MKIKLLILSLLFIFIVPIISAETIYERGQTIDLKVPFEVDGEIADTTATCNISIQYPNSTYLISTAEMTNLNNGDFNYTINGDLLLDIGVYEWNANCCEGSKCSTGYGDFEILEQTIAYTTSQAITYISLIAFVFILFFITLYYAVKIPWKPQINGNGKIISVSDYAWFKPLFFGFAYILLIFSVFLIRVLAHSYLQLEAAYSIFNYVFWILISGVLPIIVIAVFYSLVIFLTNKKLEKAIIRFGGEY